MSTRGWENATATDVRDRRTVQKPSKYRNVKKTVDGIMFDSTREANRYMELRALEHAGEIWDLELQPTFPLRVLSTSGQAFRAAQALAGTVQDCIGEMRADFSYHDRSGVVIEDVKGFDTPLSRWKRKHVEKQYNVTIRIVK